MQDIYIILEGVASNARDMDRSSVGQKIERNKKRCLKLSDFMLSLISDMKIW